VNGIWTRAGSVTGGVELEEGFLPEYTAKSSWVEGSPGDVWRHALNQIPSVFGQLVYLASLRDRTTGQYSHPMLNQALGLEDADRTLCHSHHQIFSRWLSFSLEDQKRDLDEFLSARENASSLLRYRELIPGSARDVERQLYLTDLETLLELVRFERGAAFWSPGA
jgi:hypothetical protein